MTEEKPLFHKNSGFLFTVEYNNLPHVTGSKIVNHEIEFDQWLISWINCLAG
ncbi:hypothetical protein SAMN04488072_106174 [Lentibacillus halodurans]|uniref:Uncharacterized protein n=1 Tax=Lentibacillus halodurans TaxID=237679 RepID=A0A1I0Y1Q1_9BACI|nr:hypothetical protein [Lentibacillus halodurans]SFB06807.1 hypothetical protein SAMN04488072_106174 [Lentibacillus halodurans]